ncbi:hypothetical protein [Citrobacter europaeus]|uniref:hypothetical protein n=1 Tax=Citrobacter europaeus TaxID=1914243 RepID=UPI001866A7FE
MKKEFLLSQTNLLLIVIPLLYSNEILANMRAPSLHYNAPSYALMVPEKQPTMPRLVVQSETLNVACNYIDCKVQATYHITSDADSDLEFTFIMPSLLPVQAHIAGRVIDATVEQDLQKAWTNETHPLASKSIPLYKATFSATVHVGNNHIVVSYVQPLSILEREYGYFTSSRSIERFVYVLSPLKEWQLADNFTLDVTLSTLHKRPDRDEGGFFKSRAIDCGQQQRQDKEGDRLILNTTFKKDFPNTLVCWIGDSDLLESDD